MDKYKVEKKEGLYDLYEREAEANEALYDKYAREAEANEALYDKYAREVERREKIYILDGVRGLLVNKEIPCSIKLKLIKKQMEINGELVVAVDGESMYPFIKNGDHVRIKRLKEMSIGKIVLFYTSDIFGNVKLVLHRIVKIENEKIWTKGDNNKRTDEYVYAENILGEFVEIV